MRQESKLIRNLSFWDLMAISVGQIIGAGIMSTTGVAIGMTGTGVVLAFLLSPLLTTISIFPSTVLGSAVPATGGPYRYCSRILGKVPGMIYLLLHITMNISFAQWGLSFASYFVSLVSGLNQHLIAIIILTIFFIANLVGTKTAAFVNKLITLVLIGGLAMFVIFGLPQTDFSYVFNPNNLFNNGAFAFVSVLALLSSATAGAQCLAEYGGEAKNPGKDIPKAIILSTLGVGVFYVLISMVAAGNLPIESVANQPLTLVAEKTMPKAAFYIFVIGAALGSTASTINSSFSWVTKPLLVACDDGLLPKSLGKVSDKGVPFKLLTFFYLIGIIPLIIGYDISFITKFVTANSLLSKILVCIALYKLASNRPEILTRSTMNITPKSAKVISVAGVLILILLSSSLLLNLPLYVALFIGALVLFVVIFVMTYGKNVELEDDLLVNYTGDIEDK